MQQTFSEEVDAKLVDVKTEISDSCKTILNDIKSLVCDLEVKLTQQKYKLKALTTSLETERQRRIALEAHSRHINLRINIPEEIQHLRDYVIDIFKKALPAIVDSDVDQEHRVGIKRNNITVSRAVIAKFTSLRARILIWEDRRLSKMKMHGTLC